MFNVTITLHFTRKNVIFLNFKTSTNRTHQATKYAPKNVISTIRVQLPTLYQQGPHLIEPCKNNAQSMTCNISKKDWKFGTVQANISYKLIFTKPC